MISIEEDLKKLIRDTVRDAVRSELQAKATPILPTQSRKVRIERAAEVLQLAKSTIRTKVSRGELEGVSRVGKFLLFDEGALFNYLNSGRRKLTTNEIKNQADEAVSPYLTRLK